jgi:glycosyltransferase involved in cell wall biosynthesis
MIFFLRRAHFETLTCADLDTILVGYFFKLFRKYKLFFDAHELFTDVPELKGAGLKRYIWRMVGRLGVSETDSCYTVNHSLQTILEKRFRKKFEVIPNVPSATGVNKSGAREKGPFKLVYLGVLNPGRGLPELIEAISQLEAVQCLVIGDGPERKRLEELANNAPGGGQIQFLGMIPPSEISELMIGCHLGVNLLDGTSPSYYYSLANKFFDYIHAGLPVLTMDYPEYARVNERFACCVLIKSLDTSEIMSAINGLSIDDAGYRQLCHAAHAAAAYYTWEKIEPRLLEMYRL